jgi:hypothetical protein
MTLILDTQGFEVGEYFFLWNENLWSIKYNVYADQHRHVTLKTADSNYVYYDCRNAKLGDKGPMAWMPA